MSFLLKYCQYLLSSQDNYTQTNLANHLKECSHDTINRYLRTEKVTPRLLWENVKDLVEISKKGKIILDDPVLNKRFSHQIELVRRQYSGNEHKVIKGIGVVIVVSNNTGDTISVVRSLIARKKGEHSTRPFLVI